MGNFGVERVDLESFGGVALLRECSREIHDVIPAADTDQSVICKLLALAILSQKIVLDILY